MKLRGARYVLFSLLVLLPASYSFSQNTASEWKTTHGSISELRTYIKASISGDETPCANI